MYSNGQHLTIYFPFILVFGTYHPYSGGFQSAAVQLMYATEIFMKTHLKHSI